MAVAISTIKRERREASQVTQSPVASSSQRTADGASSSQGTDSDLLALKDFRLSINGIRNITVTNFMCHDTLSVNFDPKVNFICGANGSGKSSVLAALTLVFGGNAKLTNRGTSLKNLIKAGKQKAVVRVTLHNNCVPGCLSYKHEVFGDEIIIQRTISLSGSNSYELKSRHGEIVSRKAADVHSLTQFLNIHVNNPICIMSQDVSKSFLSSSNPKKLYQFFCDSSRLTELLSTYNSTTQLLGSNQRTLDKVSALVEKESGELAVLKKRMARGEQLPELRIELKSHQASREWHGVTQIETDMERVQADAEKFEKNTKKLSTKLDDELGKEKELKKKLSICEKALNSFKSDLSQATSDVAKENKARLATIKVHNEKLASKKVLERERASVLSQLRHIGVKIAELRASDEGERQLKESRELVCQCEEEMAATTQELTKKEAERGRLAAQLAEVVNEQEHVLRSRNEANNTLQNVQNDLNQLKNAARDRAGVFGREMVQLTKLIAAEKRWHFKPIGPIGAFINLKDSRHAMGAENFIGATMLRFIVGHPDDKDLLVQLCRSNRLAIPTILRNNKINQPRYKIPAHLWAQHPELVGFFDVVDIESDAVYNTIIDICKPEGILFGTDADQAYRVSADPALLRCKKVYICDGAEFVMKKLGQTPNMYQCHRAVSGHRLIADSAGQVAALTREETKQNEALAQCAASLAPLSKRRGEAQQKVDETEHVVTRLKAKIASLNKKRRHAENVIDQLTNSIQVSSLEEEEAALKARSGEVEAQLASTAPIISQSRAVVVAAEERWKAAAEAGRLQEAEVEGRTSAYEEAQAEVMTNYRSKERLGMQLEGQRKQLAEKKATLESRRAALADAMQDAERQGPRPDRPSTLSRRDLDIAITKLEAEIRELQVEWSIDRTEFNRRMAAYTLLEERYKLRKDESGALQKFADGRLKSFPTLRGQACYRVEVYFKIFMKLRKFEGAMAFNNEAKELELVIGTPSRGEVQNTKSLSGGERSFSTVALVLSLWREVDTPFRCVDEFDVFMDNVTRETCMRMMVDICREKLRSQFVFLTPLGIGDSLREKVQLISMGNPRTLKRPSAAARPEDSEEDEHSSQRGKRRRS